MGAGGQGSAATAERMDAIYRWQRPIYDATRKFYLLGRDRLIDTLDPPPGGTVLELGSGTARNLILAARRHPGARFLGLDISAEMLATAEACVARAGLADRIRLARADAGAFDLDALFGVAGVERVFLSYSLSMIPPWRQALEAGTAALVPGGRLSVVDFGLMERYPELVRRPFRAWLAAFHVEPRAELEAALAETAARHGLAARLSPLYGGYAVLGGIGPAA